MAYKEYIQVHSNCVCDSCGKTDGYKVVRRVDDSIDAMEIQEMFVELIVMADKGGWVRESNNHYCSKCKRGELLM